MKMPRTGIIPDKPLSVRKRESAAAGARTAFRLGVVVRLSYAGSKSCGDEDEELPIFPPTRDYN
jgi:hypothetical protein